MAENGTKSLVRNAILLALYLLPLFYVSQILAVAIHEIFGHGLAALALGGRFDGCGMRWDGMGWAYASLPPGASTTANVLFLAAGVTATISSGLMFLVLAYCLRNRVAVRLGLLVLAFSCVMEGIPYVFWNSYHPTPPGDIGRILALWGGDRPPQGSMPQLMLLIGSGIPFVAGTYLFCALIFQGIEQALNDGERLRPLARFWILLLFLAIPGAASWFLFDWNQLAPGIGMLPCIAGAMSIVLSSAILYQFSLPLNRGLSSQTPTGWHLVASWSLVLLVAVPSVLWFQDGVKWT